MATSDRALAERPLRVALFTDTYTPQINGVVTSVRGLKRGLEELGHTVTVVAPRHPKQTAEDNVIRLRSTPYRPQPEQYAPIPPSLRKMLEFRRRRFDVIHSHGLAMPVIGLGVARLLGVPFVHTYHTRVRDYVHYAPMYATLSWLTDDSRWYARGNRTRMRVTSTLHKRLEISTQGIAARVDTWLCNRCLEVIAPAAPIADELVAMGVRTPISVIPNGINLALLTAPQPDPFPAHGVPPGVRRLLTVSRLGKEKSIDLLLERFKLVHGAQPDAHLILVGDGPERADLETYARSLGLEGAVTFTGYINAAQVGAYYQHAQVFVFASVSETQGLVALEAAACGLPVVARDEMGVTECVVDGKTGYLVDKDDAPAFAARVVEVLRNPGLQARLSIQSRTWAASEGSHLTMTRRILAVYDRARDLFDGWDDLSFPEAIDLARGKVDAELERFK
jgi:glycosyltransferase involved in cell wall biosynthesis